MKEDFLGKWWVPLTLLAIAASVVASITASVPVVGFLAAEALAAISITLRLTWDKRDAEPYAWIIGMVVLAHLTVIGFLSSDFSRSAGGIYMLVGLAEAALLTTLIRTTLRNA